MKAKSGKLASTILLVVVSFVSLAPFYLMLTMSTYYTEDIFQGLPIVPANYFLENLKVVLKSNFVESYLNSFTISIISTIGCVIISSMAGYAVNVYNFRFKKAVKSFIMLTMMVPTQIGIIGYMIEMRTLGLNNTLWPMILVWFANGFSVFWMMQYIEGALLMELVESGRMDGCNEIRLFFQLIIPCIIPAVVTLVLLIFLWSWNSYLVPLVFVNDISNMTIPIFIKSLGNAYRTDYGAQLAGLVVSTVPLVILFVLGSKSFIKGLTAGAVKG